VLRALPVPGAGRRRGPAARAGGQEANRLQKAGARHGAACMHAMHGPFCQRTDHRKTDIHAGTNTHAMHAAARHWQRVPSTAIRCCCPSRIRGSASRRIAMDMHDVAMGV